MVVRGPTAADRAIAWKTTRDQARRRCLPSGRLHPDRSGVGDRHRRVPGGRRRRGVRGRPMGPAAGHDQARRSSERAERLGLFAGRRLRRRLPATGAVLYHLGAFLLPVATAAVALRFDPAGAVSCSSRAQPAPSLSPCSNGSSVRWSFASPRAFSVVIAGLGLGRRPSASHRPRRWPTAAVIAELTRRRTLATAGRCSPASHRRSRSRRRPWSSPTVLDELALTGPARAAWRWLRPWPPRSSSGSRHALAETWSCSSPSATVDHARDRRRRGRTSSPTQRGVLVGSACSSSPSWSSGLVSSTDDDFLRGPSRARRRRVTEVVVGAVARHRSRPSCWSRPASCMGRSGRLNRRGAPGRSRSLATAGWVVADVRRRARDHTAADAGAAARLGLGARRRSASRPR